MTTDNGKHRVCFPSVVVTKQNHATYVAAVTPDGLGMSNIPAQYWAFKILCITRQIGWRSIMGTAKVSLAYLQGQSSPTDQTHGPDKSPVFMGGAAVSMQLLWLRMTRQLLQGVLEPDELPHCRADSESTAKDIITTVCALSAGLYREQSWEILTESIILLSQYPYQ